MEYQITARSKANESAFFEAKASTIAFGTAPQSADTLPNPAELYLGALAACMLKNVERFSGMMKFQYTQATIEVKSLRLGNPPRMAEISYRLIIHSEDHKLNTRLLQKNLEKFGTIYNTVKGSCSIEGTIEVQK